MTVDADGDLVEEGPVEEEEEEEEVLVEEEVEAVWVGDEYSNFFFRSRASFATCGETAKVQVKGRLVSFRLQHRCWHKSVRRRCTCVL